MSTSNVVLNTGQQAIVQTTTAKIFIWRNRYTSGSMANTTGALLTIPAGQVMGKIAATQLYAIMKSASSDGSQIPRGVLAETVTFAIGETKQISVCTQGDVAEEQLVLDGTDTLATLVSGVSIRDRIAADTVGIQLVTTTELTNYDNQ